MLRAKAYLACFDVKCTAAKTNGFELLMPCLLRTAAS
jgi:hypothetical protein